MNFQKSYALDTSFLIIHKYSPSPLTHKLLLKGYLNIVTISETFYVICRRNGVKEAASFIGETLKRAKLVPSGGIALLAGQFKCRYGVSLADCWTLATAKWKNIPALFGVKEKEILKYLDQLIKEVEVTFLESIKL